MKNYYHILQVNRFASAAEIKRAYRKLALQYHPDKNPHNPYAHQRFLEIGEAYERLSDPFRRRLYDESLFAPKPTIQPTRKEPGIDPNFVRVEKPMSRRDRQIFFGGLFVFMIVLLGALLIAIVSQPDPDAPDTLTDWAIREPDGHVRQLTSRELDSMFQEYRLEPGRVQDLIDSLQQ